MQQKIDWIIAHEAAHADYRHSLDKLLIQVIKIIFWFYPIHLLYEKALEVLHEYQVDARMIRLYSLDAYARLLLQLAKPEKSSLLLHNFNQFQIKKRLKMMAKTKTNRMARGIYAFALPLFACLFALISCEQNEDMLRMEALQKESDDITERLMKDDVFDVVEDMPVPQGGMEGWNNYLRENLAYPQSAKDAGIEGTVYLVFTVTKDGDITRTSILRGIGGGLDEEAMRVVRNAPNWIPGKQNGENVNVKMRVPIRFKIN
jgi:TonB family protein